MEPLTERKVNEIQNTLKPEQREFLSEHLNRSKKSKWLEVLSRKKGITLTDGMTQEKIEEELDSWVLKEVLDGGFGNRPYRCECGMPLRFQYIVLHTKEKKIYRLGETCLENYTNLSPVIISDIRKGFHTIDLERDEILIKYQNHQFFSLDKFRHIENLPEEIVQQVKVGLPLLDRQIEKLHRLKSDYDKEVQFKKVYNGFNDSQRNVFDKLVPWKREEVIEKIIEEDFEEEVLPDDFYDKEINTFMEMGFPLLDEHIMKLSEFQRIKRQQKMFMLQTEHFRPATIAPKITYTELLNRHLSTLKKVREKENDIPRGLRQDWDKIQNFVRQSKNNEEIDYSSFKLNLNNLLYALKIDPDPFL